MTMPISCIESSVETYQSPIISTCKKSVCTFLHLKQYVSKELKSGRDPLVAR